jgi:hypothetical protein
MPEYRPKQTGWQVRLSMNVKNSENKSPTMRQGLFHLNDQPTRLGLTAGGNQSGLRAVTQASSSCP